LQGGNSPLAPVGDARGAVATIGGRPCRRPERFHQWGCRGHQFSHKPPWPKPYRETPGPQSPSTYLLGVFPFQFRRRKKEVGGSGGVWGKEGGGSSVASPSTRRAGEAEDLRTGAIQGSRSGTQTRRGRSRAKTLPPRTTSPHHLSSPSQLRLHRRPNMSTTAAVFRSPPPWFLPCVETATSRRAARPSACLCAGHRAAELLSHDGSELLGHSCS
jgi:hypothetical protein